MKRGGLAPAAVNGANEAAVQLFLQHRIAFTDIAHLVYDAMESQPEIQSEISVNNILEADMAARMHVIHAVDSLG